MREWAERWNRYLRDSLTEFEQSPQNCVGVWRQLELYDDGITSGSESDHIRHKYANEDSRIDAAKPSPLPPISEEDWRAIVREMVMEPYKEDDVIVDIGGKAEFIATSVLSDIRIEDPDLTQIRTILSNEPLGIGRFMVRVGVACEQLGTGKSGIWESMAPMIDKQDVAWVSTGRTFVYSISVTTLMNMASESAEKGARIFSWICQLLAERCAGEKYRLSCQAVENFAKNIRTAQQPTKLRDGKPIVYTPTSEHKFSSEHFGLPPEANVCDAISCELSSNEPSIKMIVGPGVRQGQVVLFQHHLAFQSGGNHFTIPFSRMISVECTERSIDVTTQNGRTFFFRMNRPTSLTKLVESFWRNPDTYEQEYTRRKFSNMKLESNFPLTPMPPLHHNTSFLKDYSGRSRTESSDSDNIETYSGYAPDVGRSSRSSKPQGSDFKISVQENKPHVNSQRKEQSSWRSEAESALDNATRILIRGNEKQIEEELTKQQRLWIRLSVPEKQRIFSNASHQTLRRNQAVHRRHDGKPGIYLVVSGTIRQQRLLVQDTCLVVFENYGPGDIFGIEDFVLGVVTKDDEFAASSDKAEVSFASCDVVRSCVNHDALLQLRLYRDLALSMSLSATSMLNRNDQTFLL
eukprot:c16527_g1_i4.p1 GENE.c16527_g1_i4~~c16527_g1_i4.p1  ORF type:complete len:633 (+),score=137.69 c16527_g1_i4:2-1900(+)